MADPTKNGNAPVPEPSSGPTLVRLSDVDAKPSRVHPLTAFVDGEIGIRGVAVKGDAFVLTVSRLVDGETLADETVEATVGQRIGARIVRAAQANPGAVLVAGVKRTEKGRIVVE